MTALHLVPLVAMGVMFAAFAAEFLVSAIRRDGNYERWDLFVNLTIAGVYVLASLGLGALITIVLLIFNTPSNHRVHHATNPGYLDKYLGGALIVWDRLFGTYAAETETPVIGSVPMPSRPKNPFYLEFYLWGALIRDMFHRRRATT
jgi:hypothetical protein